MKNKIKSFLSIVIFICAIIIAGYVGIWSMFIQPIIGCCQAYDTNTLTGTMIGITIIKCIFASTISSIIFYVGLIISQILFG